MKPYLEESEVPEVVGPTTTVRGFCECRRTNLPLRVVDSTLATLLHFIEAGTDVIRSSPDPDATFLTFRCRDCKKIIRITLAGLGLVVE